MVGGPVIGPPPQQRKKRCWWPSEQERHLPIAVVTKPMRRGGNYVEFGWCRSCPLRGRRQPGHDLR